ncbi:MAG: WD40 repeat domain-containing serine/threonine-protein kinase [Planctomycetota bacterium]
MTSQTRSDVRAKIDPVCDAFEDTWRNGANAPRISDFLDKLPSDCHDSLFIELLGIEIELRAQAGALPSLANYESEFPHFVDQVRSAFEEFQMSAGDATRLETVDPGDSRTASASPTLPRDSLVTYEVLEEIDRGGMGIVHLAKDNRLKRFVAIKTISESICGDTEALNRFKIEAEATAKLNHPNVTQVYEVGLDAAPPYIVMEYADRGQLGNLSNVTSVDQKTIARIVRRIASAVDYANSTGIIHRDIKPANILLFSDTSQTSSDSKSDSVISLPEVSGNDEIEFNVIPKLTDFGLAKSLELDGTQTQTGTLIGSPCFMSPEQVAGEQRALGPATDVYGVGTVLYWLLSGHAPFEAQTPMETIELVRSEPPVRIAESRPDVDRDLETICLRCLEKSPTDRYASAGLVAEELQRFLDNRPIQARPIGSLGRLRRWCQRNSTVAWSGLITVSILLLGIAATSWQWRKAARSELAAIEAHEVQGRQASRLYFNRATELAAESNIAEGLHWMLQSLAVCPNREHDLGWRNSLRQAYANWEAELHPLLWRQPLQKEAVCIAASNDGSIALVGCLGGQLQRIDLRTGKPIGKPLQCGEESLGWSGVMALAFHPSDQWFCIGLGDRSGDSNSSETLGRVLAYSRDGVPLELEFETDLPVESLAFSNSGDSLFVATGHDQAKGGGIQVLESDNFLALASRFQTDGLWHELKTNDSKLEVTYRSGNERKTIILDPSLAVLEEKLAEKIEAGKRLGYLAAHANDVVHEHRGRQLASGDRIILTQTHEYQVLATSKSSKRPHELLRSKLAVPSTKFSLKDSAILSEDQKRLAWANEAGDVNRIHLEQYDLARSQSKGLPDCQKAVFGPNGRWFALANDGIQIFEFETGKPIGKFMEQGAKIAALAVNSDGTLIAAGDFAQEVKLWDATTGEQIGETMSQADIVISLAFSSDGRHLVAGTASDWNHDPQAQVWNVAECRKVGEPMRTQRYCRQVQFTPGGEAVLTVSDNHFRLWDAATGKPKTEPIRFTTSRCKAILDPKGEFVLSGSVTGSIQAWEVETGKPIHEKIYRSKREIKEICFSEDATLFVVGYQDGRSEIFDFSSFVPIGPAGVLPAPIKLAEITSDNRSWVAVDVKGHFAQYPILPAADLSVEQLRHDAISRTSIQLDGNGTRVNLSHEEWRQFISSSKLGLDDPK